MRIQVTQKHIDEGKKDHCFLCPVALALRDAGFGRPEVTVNRLYLLGAGCFALPDAAKTWIQDFDYGEPVQPFAFEVVEL